MYLDATKKLAESSGRIRFAKGAEFSKIRNTQEDQFLRSVSYGSCAEHICQARIIYYEKQH